AFLPLASSLALKDGITAQLVGGGTAAVSAAGGGLLTSSALKGVALKPLVGAVVTMLGAAGTLGVTHKSRPVRHRPALAPPALVAQQAMPRGGVLATGLALGQRHVVPIRDSSTAAHRRAASVGGNGAGGGRHGHGTGGLDARTRAAHGRARGTRPKT